MTECAFAETLAIELGDVGVRVNAIAPGAVAGERIQRVLQGRADASGRSLADVTADALSIQSLKHFTDPDDIAALALFLASDSAKSITGQVGEIAALITSGAGKWGSVSRSADGSAMPVSSTIPIDGGSKAAQ